MGDKFLDKAKYKKAQKLADEKYGKKNSAYKSMYLVESYEKLGGKIKTDGKDRLQKWRDEKWKNLTGVALGKR